MAKRNKMAGATVIKGVMGFGASSAVTSTRFWSVSEKLPLIIEIIDKEEKINNFFKIIEPYLEKVKKGIMVTIGTIDVLMNKSGGK
jgi:PII-like signaling protein